MTTTEKLLTIESHELSARLNLASGIHGFERIMMTEPAIADLLRELRSREAQELVFRRVLELVQVETDARFERDSDVALAVYLRLLSLTEPTVSAMAAKAVLGTPGCWWATTIAREILTVSPRKSDSGAETIWLGTTSSAIAEESTAGNAVFVVNAYSQAPVRFRWPERRPNETSGNIYDKSTRRIQSGVVDVAA